MILESFVCPAYFYKCPKSFCLDGQYVCDGTPHCPDGEDELGCGNATILLKPCRQKTCLWGFRQTEFQTNLLCYRD